MSSRLSIISLWFCYIALLILGIIMVASTGLNAPVPDGDDPAMFLYKQSFFAVLGLILAGLISHFDYHYFRRFIIPMWIILTLLLACCWVPGFGMELNGEKRWLNFGFITLQPSELAKSVLVICLADWYATHREMAGSFWKGFVLPAAICGVPLLLILMEKDMGTAAALGVSCFCLMYVAGVRVWILVLCIIVGFSVLYWQATDSPNRLERIFAWMDPQNYSQGAGRQQWISILAFARGNLTGVGLGNGIEKFGNLPFAHTDFIFAEIGEEWGLVGSAGVLLLFTIMTLSGIVMALQTNDTFGRLIAVGLVCTIFWPALLNMMVVTSLLPNSGLPLPFISYGGTSLVLTTIAIGILTSIHRCTPHKKAIYWPTRRLQQNKL